MFRVAKQRNGKVGRRGGGGVVLLMHTISAIVWVRFMGNDGTAADRSLRWQIWIWAVQYCY
jgi:hypothetical protein